MRINNKEVRTKINCLRLCLKYGRHYFIGYNEADETLIIKNLLKYNSSFIIVKTNYIDLFDNEQTFCFDCNDIDLNILFLDRNSINIDYADKMKVSAYEKYTNYIYFYMIPNMKDIIEPDYIKHYILQIGRIMIDNISKYCVFDKEIIFDKIILFKFIGSGFENKESSSENIFLSVLNGIGDFFLTFSIINEYLAGLKSCKCVYLINARISETCKYMINLCYGDKVIILNNDACNSYFLEYFRNEKLTLPNKINDMFALPPDKTDHMAVLFKQCLFGEKEIDFYQHNDILKEKILENVSDEEKDYIDSLIKNKNNIGLQYFTGWFNAETCEWHFFGDKKWDAENVKQFIIKCKENDMNIIVLNSESYDSSLQEFCTKKLSITGYALLISKMDLLVGVDSSGGHIASFYDIPSITLWGAGSPLVLNYSDYYGDRPMYMGYRALRKNYSIIAKDKDMSAINYNTVFDFVEKFFSNELSFKDEIITYQDSAEGYNMIYI